MFDQGPNDPRPRASTEENLKIKHMWDDPMMVQSPRDVIFPCSWSVHMYIHVPPTGHLYAWCQYLYRQL